MNIYSYRYNYKSSDGRDVSGNQRSVIDCIWDKYDQQLTYLNKWQAVSWVCRVRISVVILKRQDHDVGTYGCYEKK